MFIVNLKARAPWLLESDCDWEGEVRAEPTWGGASSSCIMPLTQVGKEEELDTMLGGVDDGRRG